MKIYFSTAIEMERLDNLAVKNGLEIRQMMELAGWRMVQLFTILKLPRTASIVVACGKGNNGGDGLAAARFLINEGWKVGIVLAEVGLNDNAKHHLELLEKMKVPIAYFDAHQKKSTTLIAQADIIVDALFGYHIRGNPRPPYDRMIQLINATKATVIAYDLPSGQDGTTGCCFSPCVRAHYTLTLALPKRGFMTRIGQKQTGRIYVGDIGIPEFLYDKVKKHSRPNFNNGLIKI